MLSDLSELAGDLLQLELAKININYIGKEKTH